MRTKSLLEREDAADSASDGVMPGCQTTVRDIELVDLAAKTERLYQKLFVVPLMMKGGLLP